jgi:hypothetical protein
MDIMDCPHRSFHLLALIGHGLNSFELPPSHGFTARIMNALNENGYYIQLPHGVHMASLEGL